MPNLIVLLLLYHCSKVICDTCRNVAKQLLMCKCHFPCHTELFQKKKQHFVSFLTGQPILKARHKLKYQPVSVQVDYNSISHSNRMVNMSNTFAAKQITISITS